MARDRHAARLMRDFGRRLRAARITAGYDEAADFAAVLGLESPRYRRYERGESMPPLDVLEDIADRTRRSLDWLLLGRGAPGRRE